MQHVKNIVIWYVLICLNALELPAKPNIHITYHSVPCMVVPVTLTNHGADKMNLTNFASNVFVWVNSVFWNPEKKTTYWGLSWVVRVRNKSAESLSLRCGRGDWCFDVSHTGHVPPRSARLWNFDASVHLSTVATFVLGQYSKSSMVIEWRLILHLLKEKHPSPPFRPISTTDVMHAWPSSTRQSYSFSRGGKEMSRYQCWNPQGYKQPHQSFHLASFPLLNDQRSQRRDLGQHGNPTRHTHSGGRGRDIIGSAYVFSPPREKCPYFEIRWRKIWWNLRNW